VDPPRVALPTPEGQAFRSAHRLPAQARVTTLPASVDHGGMPTAGQDIAAFVQCFADG
jgi:hypothetical protein